MDVYKIKVDTNVYKKINLTDFENDTQKKYPYYQNDKSGHYAVCPACNNPILIVGLIKRSNDSVTSKPFGKHHPYSIPELADYDKTNYLLCPYSKPSINLTPNSRRESRNGIPNNILALLRDQFDRVIYLLGKDIGFNISDSLAKEMLKQYLSVEGFMYSGASLMNIPWIFAYMCGSNTLWGRYITDEELKAVLIENIPSIIITEKGQITGDAKDLRFCFRNHQIIQSTEKIGSHNHQLVRETIIFDVSYVRKNEHGRQDLIIIYSKEIDFNYDYFQNLIGIQAMEKRNQKLIDIAREEIQI